MGVKKALAGVPGINVLTVEIGKAEVEYQGSLNVEKIKEAIDDEGYEVISIA